MKEAVEQIQIQSIVTTPKKINADSHGPEEYDMKTLGKMDVLESRERVLLNMHHEMTEEMSLLRDLTQRAVALKAGDRKRRLKIEKITRITGGRPGPRDMVVSVSQFSIAWNQIDTILDKLDEITHKLWLIK